jgi:hypothetical protein
MERDMDPAVIVVTGPDGREEIVVDLGPSRVRRA